jgi:HEAT repeat protein
VASLTGAATRLGLLLWPVGALVYLISRILWGLTWMRGRRFSSAPPALTALVKRVADELRMKHVPVVVTSGLAMPVVTGLVRPRLLWPLRLLDSVEPRKARTLIAHELAHVKRLDLWASGAEFAVSCVWWWYPGWYWVRRRFRDASERACDARVVALYPESRREYAEALLDAFARCPRPAPVVVRGLGEPNQVRRRLRAIFDSRRAGSPLVGWLAASSLLVALTPGWLRSDPVSDDPSAAMEKAVSAIVPLGDAGEPPSPLGGSASDGQDRPRALPDSALIANLRSSDPEVRKQAVATIGRKRLHWAIPWIYPLASDSTAVVRWQVAASIGLAEPEHGLPTLVDLLGDRDARVRESATWALTGYAARTLLAGGALPLLETLTQDSDPGVRRQAAATISISEIDGGIPLLLGLFDDESAAVRATAVWGLGDLRRIELTRRILPLAKDPHPAVREGVARALWLLPAPEWLESVQLLATDSDPDVRAKGRMALSRFDAS